MAEQHGSKQYAWQQEEEAEIAHLQMQARRRENDWVWGKTTNTQSLPQSSSKYVLHKPISPKPPQTAPPPGDQVSKCLSLWAYSNHHNRCCRNSAPNCKDGIFGILPLEFLWHGYRDSFAFTL